MRVFPKFNRNFNRIPKGGEFAEYERGELA